MVGCAGLYLAAVFDSISYPSLDELAYMSRRTYTTENIVACAKEMLIMFGFARLSENTPIDVLVKEWQYMYKQFDSETGKDMFFLAKYICSEMVSQFEWREYDVVKLAKACLDVAIACCLAKDLQSLVQTSDECRFVYKCWANSAEREYANDVKKLYSDQLYRSVAKRVVPWVHFTSPKVGAPQRGDTLESINLFLPEDPLYLKNLTKRFTKHRNLGSGGYANVYEISLDNKPERYAMKECQCDEVDLKTDSIREIHALSKLKHKNIVVLKGYYFGESAVYIVMELLGHTLLKTVCPTGTPRCLFEDAGVEFKQPKNAIIAPWEVKMSWSKQLLSAVAYMHEQGIIHRDLCPRNVMMGNTLKVIDFGISRYVRNKDPSNSHTCLVTKWCYRAPEAHLTQVKQYGPALDVWSCACIIYEIFAGEACFYSEQEFDQVYALRYIVKRLGAPARGHEIWSWKNEDKLAMKSEKLSRKICKRDYKVGTGLKQVGDEKVEKILQEMLTYSPNVRLTAQQAFERFNVLSP